LNTFDVTAMTAPNPWYFTSAWSRDGTRMAFEEERCATFEPDSFAPDETCPAEDYSRDIVVVDAQSGHHYPENLLYVLNNDGRPVANPTFSPDGTKVAALVQNQTGLYLYSNIMVFDLVSGSAEVITTLDPDLTNLYGSRPSWSPTGDWIAYTLYVQYDQENGAWKREGDLFLVSPDGAGEIRLTDDEFINMQPSWSPDGQWLVYSSDRDGEQSMDIWIMDRNGGNNTKLYDCSPANCYSPTFSPDGLQVAFSNGSSIYTVNVDGDQESLEEIAVPGYATGGITWSPFIAEPFIEVQNDSPSIGAFGTATLSWQSQGAREVLISGIPDSQPANGSLTVSPGSTTVYTLTAVGPAGASEARVTVTVE
ncbi:MAG: TolB family protein, partial [Desulforhopalus sp.]